MFYVITARMIKRQVQSEIAQLLQEFPAVGVLGNYGLWTILEKPFLPQPKPGPERFTVCAADRYLHTVNEELVDLDH
jgi:hypothetical protein